MIEKNKILESWIMVEHLSEGDIGLNDKATDRKLSCVAVTLKLSMINRVSDFRERRKRLCL